MTYFPKFARKMEKKPMTGEKTNSSSYPDNCTLFFPSYHQMILQYHIKSKVLSQKEIDIKYNNIKYFSQNM
jgi:hypothetical protein